MKFKMIVFSLIVPMLAHAGQDRGGGSDTSLGFLADAKTGLAVLQSSDLDDASKSALEKINTELSKTKIILVENKLYSTFNERLQPSIAINFPKDHLIEIYQVGWNAISSDLIRQALAVHELASLIGEESTGDYHFSSRILRAANVSGLQENAIVDVLNNWQSLDVGNNSLQMIAPSFEDGIYVKSQNDVCGLSLRLDGSKSALKEADVAVPGRNCPPEAIAPEVLLPQTSRGTFAFSTDVLVQHYPEQALPTKCDLKKSFANCSSFPWMYDKSTGQLLAQNGDFVHIRFEVAIVNRKTVSTIANLSLIRNGQEVLVAPANITNFQRLGIEYAGRKRQPTAKKPVARNVQHKLPTPSQRRETIYVPVGPANPEQCFPDRNPNSPFCNGPFGRPSIGIQTR